MGAWGFEMAGRGLQIRGRGTRDMITDIRSQNMDMNTDVYVLKSVILSFAQ